MVSFLLCTKSCLTCACIVPATTFTSSAHGGTFDGVYEFDTSEATVLSCRSVNCIYMLQCDTCSSQYVGETVQFVKDRMSGHRSSTIPGKDTGNFRLRQHYACSMGKCSSFKIFIIQKLAGSGRTDVKRDKSDLFTIDPSVTKIRKLFEDTWVRKLHTQYPYGCNDRIDSLPDKYLYNCEFAKFISVKSKRRRSWSSKSSLQCDMEAKVNDILNSLLNYINLDFNCSFIDPIKCMLFPLKRSVLLEVRKRYLDKVFTDVSLKHEILRKHVHFVIMDLLTYKIQPFVTESRSVTPKKIPKLLFNIEFVNKAIDMINLPRLFRDKELKSFVNFCNVKEPSVVYSSKPDISGKIFNYNSVINDFTNLSDIDCMCSEFSEYINKDCMHVATGNISIFKCTKLIDILKKGPRFREPVSIDFDNAHKAIMLNFVDFIKKWSLKEKLPVACFQGWVNKFKDLLDNEIKDLKIRYRVNRKLRSVFSDPDVKAELDYFHKYFVICPVDKATKNISIICKHFYISTVLNECMNNTKSYHNITDLSIQDICMKQKEFLKLSTDSDIEDKLPHIVLFPKFHKPKFSQRFVVSYSNCLIKPLAKRITLGLKAIYQQVCSYSNMIFKVTGIKRNWIVNNNVPILECLNNICTESRARNIQTYDFTTLYTNLEHEEIKVALASVLKLCFKHSKKKYIAIYAKSFAWVDSTRDGTYYFDMDSFMKSIEFLMDNCYFTLGSNIFRQVIGVPIGVDPGPYIANLTLWFYENRYMEKLYKVDYFRARKLNHTFRLIDDITSINSDGVFQDHASLIYPTSLILNKENVGDDEAHVLDLNILVKDGQFNVSLYDKRDDFPFDIVQFIPIVSNMPVNTAYGVFGSQLIRYFRICNLFVHFETRVSRLVQSFVELGYCKKLLKCRYLHISRKYSFKDKFGIADPTLITLFI